MDFNYKDNSEFTALIYPWADSSVNLENFGNKVDSNSEPKMRIL